MSGFVLTSMLFMHVVDDYYLLGILANLKQRSYWDERAPDPMYRYDYLVALLMHSLSWSFCIMLPAVASRGFAWNEDVTALFTFNIVVHAVTDDAKANRRKINLITDQAIHLVQILMTFFALYTC